MSNQVANIQVTSHAAGKINKPFTPYFSQTYFSPQQVLNLFPTPDVTFRTPGFTEGQKEFTSQEQMMTFLHELNDTTDHMRMEIIGHSLEGREIPMLVFTTSTSEDSEEFNCKPTVWIQANVHGHEPAAGESVLVIAQKLAKEDLGQELLQDINVIIVPRMNPDGAYYFEQESANNINGNRDHVHLEMPELQAIHTAFNKYQAEVVIDAHEYEGLPTYHGVGEKGAVRYHDVLLLSGKNLNIPENIRKKSDEWFVESAFEELEKEGFSYGSYFTVNSLPYGEVIAEEGGVDVGIGRNAFGLKPSFCFLTETRGIGIGRENFLRRVAGQVTTHTSILKTTKKHAGEIKQMVDEAKSEIIDKGNKGKANGTIVLKSQPKEVMGQKVKAIDIAKGEVIEIPVKYFSTTDSYPTLERVRPNAYLLPPAYHPIAEKLMMQGAQIQKLEENQEFTVECYNVLEKEVDGPTNQLLIRTELEEKKVFFPKGSYVIHCAQPAANLIALSLEPESDYSYVVHNYFRVSVGRELPIYRSMKSVGHL